VSFAHPISERIRHHRYRLLASLFLLALLIRVQPIGIDPKRDVEITLKFVRTLGFAELFVTIPRVQPHFPLYYLLLEAWGLVAPLRSAVALSLGAAALLVPFVYFIARHWTDERGAAIATGLVLLSPLLQSQADWLRMYPLLALTVTASWWAAWRWIEGRGPLWAWASLALAAVGLHPYGAVFVAAQTGWLALEQHRTYWRRRWVALVVPVLAVGTVLVSVLLGRVLDLTSRGTIDVMHTIYLGATAQRLLVAPLATLTGPAHSWVGVVLLAGLFGVGAIHLGRQRVWESREGRLLLVWIALPMVLLAGANAVFPLFQLKYLGGMAPAVALVIGRHLPRSRASQLWLGSVVVFALGNLVIGVFEFSVAQVAVSSAM
jgi:hypothetical protein